MQIGACNNRLGTNLIVNRLIFFERMQLCDRNLPGKITIDFSINYEKLL